MKKTISILNLGLYLTTVFLMLAKEKALYRLVFFAAIVERHVCNRELVKKVFGTV